MKLGNEPYCVNPTKNERDAWDRRASVSGCSFKGVLFKSFPESLNRVLHKFHVEFISEGLSGVDGNISILDAGCGYGRISAEIRNRFSRPRIFGLDSSWHFIKSYTGYVPGITTGIRGDVTDLPFQSESFDAVVIVTCLMYIPSRLRQRVLREIFRVTREGGMIIVIEPGLIAQRIYSCFGLLDLVNKHSNCMDLNTGGTGSTVRELSQWTKDNDGDILNTYANPGFALILPLLLVASRFSFKGLLHWLLQLSGLLDRILHKKPYLSLHIGLIIRKG